MIKTFAFVLITFFNDGTQHRETLAENISAKRCANLLTSITERPLRYRAELVEYVVVACEEEIQEPAAQWRYTVNK